MADPSETASASDLALDIFGGLGTELDDFSIGDAAFREPANTGVIQTVFGQDVFDNLDFARAVDSCFKSLESKPILLPWESRSWRPIFQQNFNFMDDFSMGSIFRPTLPGPAVEISVQKKIKLSPPVVLSSNFARAVVKHPEETWMDKRDSELQTGLKRWLTCISSWDPSEKVVQELHGCTSIADGLTLLRDYMGTKAPATLYKRVNSLGILFQHVRVSDFPCTELQLYQALCDLRSAGCKPSRIKGIVEAVTFCRFVFDIGKLQACVSSRRCLGVARGLPSDSPSQAAPLTVMQLTELHRLVLETSDPWDRVFAGAVLFCVYSRSRWMDFQHGSELRLEHVGDDIRYISCKVSTHKTMHASAFRFRFLELCAPASGVVDSDWIKGWLEARALVGIQDEHPPMPAPSVEGKPTVRPLGTDECGVWLRLLLQMNPVASQNDVRITSHSCKCTILSYAAKRGLPHEERLVLGHHAHQGRMADVYARDAEARPMRMMEELLSEIRAGRFFPDESRAGRLVEVNAKSSMDVPLAFPLHDALSGEPVTVKEHSSEAGWECISVASSSSEYQASEAQSEHVTTDSSSDESEQSCGPPAPARLFHPPVPPDGCYFLQHSKSKTLHIIQNHRNRILECGRQVTDAYTRDFQTRWDSSVCSNCLKHQAGPAKS